MGEVFSGIGFLIVLIAPFIGLSEAVKAMIIR